MINSAAQEGLAILQAYKDIVNGYNLLLFKQRNERMNSNSFPAAASNLNIKKKKIQNSTLR